MSVPYNAKFGTNLSVMFCPAEKIAASGVRSSWDTEVTKSICRLARF